MRNALNHSSCDNICVRLAGGEKRLYLEVTDDGCGFDVENMNGHHGIGIASMKERAILIHADIAITSQVGIGTIIRLSLDKLRN
ncbi:MAG: hypothetical protein KAH23_07545 [Kiritimatiellae bacterium]|nr:hypothetical protein [Kiritimatiellia bacterium]